MNVTVDKLIYGGYGLARYRGEVVLVPFAAPGDRLVVQPIERKKGFIVARIERILEPSPVRRPPRCPHFQTCGGCQLQHLTATAAREAKSQFVRESLVRLGGIDWPHEIALISGPEYEYRLRTQLKIAVHDDRVEIGYFKPASHELCPIDACPLLSPTLNEALSRLRRLPARSFRGVKTIDLVEGAGGQVATHPVMRPWSVEEVAVSVGEWTYHVDARSFFQVNRFLLGELLNFAVGSETCGEVAVDLYCGVGFFSLPLARSFDRVIGVESDAHSVRWARENARRHGLENIEFVVSSVEGWLERNRGAGSVGWVLVDPPRSGLSKRIVRGIVGLGPSAVTYISCNPTTLARDLKWFQQGGYRLSSLVAIDLFPQTFHIETVAQLVRR